MDAIDAERLRGVDNVGVNIHLGNADCRAFVNNAGVSLNREAQAIIFQRLLECRRRISLCLRRILKGLFLLCQLPKVQLLDLLDDFIDFFDQIV